MVSIRITPYPLLSGPVRRHRESYVTEVITVEQELGSRFSVRVYKGEASARRIISGASRYVTKSKNQTISIDVIYNPA